MALTPDNYKVEQKAQEPRARVGDNQSERVPTHEGSQLNKPSMAGNSEAKTPHL
jgi:hypothetical protein